VGLHRVVRNATPKRLSRQGGACTRAASSELDAECVSDWYRFSDEAVPGCRWALYLIETSAAGKRGPRTFEREGQCFPGNARDERSDDHTQAKGGGSRQGDRFTLDVGAAVALEKAPVTIEPPQVAAIAAHRLFTTTVSTFFV
jgi:hypothetical protein